MNIISRKEAKAQGLTRYFTGKPCKHGHLSERQTSNGSCVTCQQQKTREWRQENPDIAEQHRINWETKNPTKAQEVVKAAQKRWEVKNPEVLNAKAAKYRALKRGTVSSLSQSDKDRIKAVYAECRRLNREAGCIAYHVDHIHPIAKGGVHHPDNLQILSAKENRIKGCKVA